jgi:hypothetical protein
MGVIIHRDGRPFVFEAIATVRYTSLAQWTARSTGGMRERYGANVPMNEPVISPAAIFASP